MPVCARVAPLRMRVWRVVPGTQVIPDFELRDCPWRATSADQGSLSWPLLKKRHRHFSVRIWKQQNLWETANPHSKISVRTRIEQKKSLGLFSKRDTQKLPWSAKVALQGQPTTAKSGRTCVPGSALPTPILKGATLPVIHVACLWMWFLLCCFFIDISAYVCDLKSIAGVSGRALPGYPGARQSEGL